MPKLKLNVSRPCVCNACGRGFAIIAPHVSVRLLKAFDCYCPFCGVTLSPAHDWQTIPKVWTYTARLEEQMGKGKTVEVDPGSFPGFSGGEYTPPREQRTTATQRPADDPMGHNKKAHQRPRPPEGAPDTDDDFWSSIFGDDFPTGRK